MMVWQESRYWITKDGATVSAHEIGHYFNLNHTFNGGCKNDDCLLDGDQVCDTPPDDSPSFSDCNTNSCNTDVPDKIDDNTNYMDYTSCVPPHFTVGQKDRMILGLEKGRPELIISQGCIPVAENDAALISANVNGGGCGTAVCSQIIIQNTGIKTITSLKILIEIDGATIITFPWVGNLLANSNDTINLPCVTATIGVHNLTIELKDPNSKPDGYAANNSISYNKLNIYPKPNISLVKYESTHCGFNGKIEVKATGGKAPYQYYIDSDPLKPQISPVFYDLHNIQYAIVVIDTNNCRDTLIQTIPDLCPPCLSGVINKYGLIYSICDSATLNIDDASIFAPGDKVLIYQAKGANVDSTNTASFGNILNYGNAGNYEYNRISSIVGNKIILKYYIIHHFDAAGLTQIVSVPDLKNASVCNLTCKPWDGFKGGLLVFDADTLNMVGNIDVSGNGFRGGIVENALDWNPPFDNYFSNNHNNGGTKGEGIAILGSNYKFAKGKVANAGGGGNDHNAGGGGGANFGNGGIGGMGYKPQNYPKIQGLNGVGLDYLNYTNRLFFGGGAGAAHSNIPGCGTGTSGGNGGGIVILNIKSCIANNNKIISSGIDALSTGVNGCDGAGGGGAGGTILFNSQNGIPNLIIETNGRNGGDAYYIGPGYVGPGGGGGGGILFTNLSIANLKLTHITKGGNNGLANGIVPYGAKPGDPGGLITDIQLQEAKVLYNPIGLINLKIDTICNNPGIVTITTMGGTEVSEFKIDQGNWQNTGIFQDVENGKHLFSIRSKCIQIDTLINISWPVPLMDSLLFFNSVSCKEKGRIGIIGLNGSPPYLYKINNGVSQTNGIFENLDPGDYTISIMDSRGCQIDKIYTIFDLAVNLNLITDSLDLKMDCFDTTSFIAVHAEGSNPYYYYSLNGGTKQAIGFFKNLKAGKYTIIAYDEYGCFSQTIEYTVTSNAAYIINNEFEICEGESITVGTNHYFISGIYVDSFKTSFGCDSIINTNLSVVLFKTKNQNITLCKGDNIQVGNNSYNISGIYLDSLVSKGGCDSIVTTKLNVINPSIASLSFNICEGDSILVNNKNYDISGSYTDKLLNYQGCDSIINIHLSISDTVFYYQTISLCEGDSLLLGNQLYTKIGEYKSLFISSNGCDSTVITRIVKTQPALCDSITCRMYIPNAFSPNGDGINDNFEIFTPVAKITQMDIYDRWGELVSSLNNISPKWNGKTKAGKNLHEGVYVYVIYGSCSNGKKFIKSGDVTLIR